MEVYSRQRNQNVQRPCGKEHEGPEVSCVAVEPKARGCDRRYVAGKVIRGQATMFKTRKELLLRSCAKGLRTWLEKNSHSYFH